MERKKNIAFFMGLLENEYSGAILDGALKGAKDFDVNLFVFPMDIINAEYVNWEVTKYRYQYNMLDSYFNADSLDGVIIEYGSIAAALNEEQKNEFLAMTGNKPTILLCDSNINYTSVCVENTSGLIEVIEHLILEHHYTKIGFLSGTKDNYDAEMRLQVYKDTMKKHNLYRGDDWIEYGNFSTYVSDQVTRLVERHPDMEVLVCANDAMAIGACDTLKTMGRIPGKDIFITGFDDIASGFLNEPTITSVSTNPDMLAYTAIQELLNYRPEPHSIFINTKMVLRESCGCEGFEVDEKWKKSLGIYDDWRQIAQFQLNSNEKRRGLEHELCNVTRDMVFNRDTEKERYEAILKTVRRLEFKKCALFLYDEYITHKRDDVWNNPESINLVGYYDDLKGYDDYTFALGELKVKTTDIFDNKLINDGQRHEVVVLPLFFGEKQMGLFMADTDKIRFQYAYDMAGQISNTLYIIDMNETQQRMKLALEEASKSKSSFLANMSHEIRTPINAVIGFNEMIIRENRDEDIAEYARDIKNAANALLLIVNDTLDFSKIEAGKMELISEQYSLSDVVRNIVGMLNERAEKKGLSLFTAFDSTIPKQLIGDDGRLQQILINLISNAIKYTNEGTVTLSIDNKKIENDKITLHFSVKDTGTGIKEEDISHLFNMFERIDEKKNRHIEGTGLGLNIVTGLLALMDSELHVNSTYGEGSDFYFDITQKIATEEPDQPSKGNTAEPDKDGGVLRFEAPEVKILVVDDNFLNRKVFGSLLKETKIQVDKAESGKKCLEMLENESYDLVFLDHMMPEMDGIETFEIIRKEKIIDIQKTPVIALTANALSGAKEEYLKIGFSDYLPKPVLPNDLYKMILKYIDSNSIRYV